MELERSAPTSPITANTARYTSGMASGRGIPRRARAPTGGLRMSAAMLAKTTMSRTGPIARASSHRPRMASGTSTSWIHRGTITGGTGRPAGARSLSGGAARARQASRRSPTALRMSVGLRLIEPSESMAPRVARPETIRPVSILFVGDIVGGLGRRTILALLPALRERLAPDFVVVNGENIAGGLGITPKGAKELFAAGVDVITLGNHTYRHREVYGYLDAEPRILRPANFLRGQPGHGWCTVERDGVRLGVVSISGNLYMNASLPAFSVIENAIAALEGEAD